MNKKNYSIIIPHHNIPILLQRCIDSIPQRKDTEIIIVDDNSSEEFVNFNHFPGKERTDVTIIFTKEGKGAGYARNIGLSQASGKWILFADADDFFNYCIKDVLDEYIDSKYDIVFFKVNSIHSDTYESCHIGDHINKWIDLYTKSPLESEKYLRFVWGEPWCKLIKRDLIYSHQIRFEEIEVQNDTIFSLLTGFYANNISIDKRHIYNYTYRHNSITTVFSEKKLFTRILVCAKREIFYRQHNIHLHDTWIWEHLNTLLSTNKELYLKGIKELQALGFKKDELNHKLSIWKIKHHYYKLKRIFHINV